jgi:hypothetical protein
MCRRAREGEWPWRWDSFKNGDVILLSDSQLFGVAYGGLTDLRGAFTVRAHQSELW